MRYLTSILAAIVLSLTMTPVPAQDEEGEQAAEAAEEDQPEERRVRRLGDVVGGGDSEFSMDIPVFDAPVEPTQQTDRSLPDEEQDALLQQLLTRRAFMPDNEEVQQALDELLDDVEQQAQSALGQGDMELAGRLVSVLEEVDPERGVIAEVNAEIERREGVDQALANAAAAQEAGRYVEPPGDNAAEYYQRALELDSGNQAALSGQAELHAVMMDAALARADNGNFEGAAELLDAAGAVHEAPEVLAETREEVAGMRRAHLEEVDNLAVAAIDEGDLEAAEEYITQLVALGHERSRIDSLQGSVEDYRLYGSFEPGQVFSEEIERLNRQGPEMVVVPAGSFRMGSPDDEEDRMRNEGPVHRVSFERGFALAESEITVGEFAAFVEDTGYQTDAEREGASRIYDPESGRMDRENGINWRHDYTGENADDELPVIHVSWNDATAYAEWLSEQTGRSYRLPSEAEFEYALRAGSQAPYWWGEGSPDEATENLTGDRDLSPTNARWNVAFRRYEDGHWGPAPAGAMAANPFGLHDMGGNVMEWTADCWHDSFVRAPEDGSAWINPGCERRVIKGGSWASTPAMSRAAFRLSSVATSTDMRVGFRVARDL